MLPPSSSAELIEAPVQRWACGWPGGARPQGRRVGAAAELKLLQFPRSLRDHAARPKSSSEDLKPVASTSIASSAGVVPTPALGPAEEPLDGGRTFARLRTEEFLVLLSSSGLGHHPAGRSRIWTGPPLGAAATGVNVRSSRVKRAANPWLWHQEMSDWDDLILGLN